MTKDSILKVFTPKYHALYPVFEKSADNLIMASGRLKILLNTTDISEQEAIILEISELEKKGNTISGEMYSIVNSLIINPFDREDINRLVNRVETRAPSRAARLVRPCDPLKYLIAFSRCA